MTHIDVLAASLPVSLLIAVSCVIKAFKIQSGANIIDPVRFASVSPMDRLRSLQVQQSGELICVAHLEGDPRNEGKE